MPQFAANLSMLYNEHAFINRFEAAAKDGFKAVEYLFPYAFEADALKDQLLTHGLQQVLFNAPPGDWDAGERGLACLPGREDEFKRAFEQALAYADRLECPRIHVMAGIKPTDKSDATLAETYQRNIAWAAQQAAPHGRDVLIEPINTRDMPGYFLNYQGQAHDVIEAIGAANLKVQMDLYHLQIMEGDLAAGLRKWLPTGRVGHLQIAGVPMRHEPDIGEINYAYLFDVIDELSGQSGWDGWIGCEYRPARGAVENGTSDGLAWFKHR
ncbi:MAG: 2-oxo-tetronate isomerase [Burkholderiaceae bacterium]|nr:2-oxo-tetronate isomerase [Burkholderiaceae bacterium]